MTYCIQFQIKCKRVHKRLIKFNFQQFQAISKNVYKGMHESIECEQTFLRSSVQVREINLINYTESHLSISVETSRVCIARRKILNKSRVSTFELKLLNYVLSRIQFSISNTYSQNSSSDKTNGNIGNFQ